MEIHLPKGLEDAVRSLVEAGRYASVDEAMAEAARLLLGRPPEPDRPMTERELHQYMLDVGLMTQLPGTRSHHDDPDDRPIDIRGEPLSETIIRGRR